MALLTGSACVRTDGDPARSATRLALAKDHLAKNELEAAELEANRAISFQPGNEEAYNLRGLVHYVRAVGIQRALEVDRCETGVDAESLGEVLDGHLIKAQQDFRKAAELAPDYGEAWSNLGVVSNLLGDYDAGVESLTTALANPTRLQEPGLTRAHLGWSYFLRGDHVRAANELLQALQFQPTMCVATYRLGRVYFAREEWDKAAEHFQHVSEQPACQSQEAALYLMKTRMEQGLVEEARVARQTCLQVSPESCAAAQCSAGDNNPERGERAKNGSP